jgi:hypothetical protein
MANFSLSEFGDDTEERTCVECGRTFVADRDIQLCDRCIKKFDLDKLWKLHDDNKLDALDFNESKSMRERFRIRKRVK